MPRKQPETARNEIQKALHRATAVRLHLQGQSQQSIASELGIGVATVNADLAHMRRQWLANTRIDLDNAKAREVAKIDNLEATYWDAYHESPHPSLLDGILKCIDRRCKLLGLDAPIKVDERILNFTIHFDTPLETANPSPIANGIGNGLGNGHHPALTEGS